MPCYDAEMDEALYRDNEAARQHLEALRWPDGVVCPFCELSGKITALPLDGAMGPGWYHCEICRRKFTVRTGTPFHRARVPFSKLLRAAALIADEPACTITSLCEAGLSYKTAHRLYYIFCPGRRPRIHAKPSPRVDTAAMQA